jgi:hypothetical protein
MKKPFHVLVAGLLVLSITGCGKSATSKTRNGGLMSTSGLGASLVSGIAMNALTMIPGMPKELSALLGGGGADNAEVLAAIAAIEAHLVKIDEKLAEISNQVKTVQSGVDDTIGLVNFVIKQNDCASADAKYAQLLPLTVAIDAKWKILFGDKVNAGLLRGIATRIKKDANNDALGNGEFTFTSSETQALNDVRRVLRDNEIDLALAKLRKETPLNAAEITRLEKRQAFCFENGKNKKVCIRNRGMAPSQIFCSQTRSFSTLNF